RYVFLHDFCGSIISMFNGWFYITGNLLVPYANYYFLLIIFIILIIFGAIGFPVLIEVKNYLSQKKKKRKRFRFSLFTKVTYVTFAILISFGTLFIYLMDINHYFKGSCWYEYLSSALYT